jgi:endonuclease III
MESIEAKKKRAAKIADILASEYHGAKVHLDFENPFQLLISTILAAQCTDALVNKVMGPLYKKKYKGPKDFLKVSEEEIQKDIYPITFYRNKSRSVKKCCRQLVEEFKGEVPDNMKDLMSLGGVGRKTANVILANCFGKQAIITDTHVIRLSQRLDLTQNEIGDKIEQDLLKIIPEEKQTVFSHTLSEHGRQICKARKPKCPICVINALCPSRNLFIKEGIAAPA